MSVVNGKELHALLDTRNILDEVSFRFLEKLEMSFMASHHQIAVVGSMKTVASSDSEK